HRTPHFRAEFIKRRGYDPLPFYPVYAGNIVESLEISERFLWDLRQTSQELVLEYHASAVKKYGHKNNLGLSIEPYDMNPTADLELGNIADVPMAEFWSKGYGFNSSFSCFEATSIAHVNGKSLVPAEAFTAQDNEGWKQYPGAMKNQGDWAFATGINRFVFHTFQNQVLADSLRPGITMGPYGVHWDRNQTWWPMVGTYHQYVSRCSYLLQQGNTVADVLYLTPEGSPHVFRPPFSAIEGDVVIPDRKGYNFDGCAPGQLYKASVKNGRVVFPGGASYRILVLPRIKTMTPALLEKIGELVKDGAVVVGAPPLKSPGLSGYPACDEKVSKLAKVIWGINQQGGKQTTHTYGKGKVIWGGELGQKIDNLYPEYNLTAELLKSMNVKPDFETD
ncbi:MAG TPA: glycosyl hydrolase, partial [Chitinophagaceae bacterium]|nr:glycosyl hydrolase [Chitinophagaceae bacterium]